MLSLFTCTTVAYFVDFNAERNILQEKAYPELRKYCSEFGLDLEVVDMRWGLTDDVINDHQVSALCIDEIITCQNVSCGPNFVVSKKTMIMFTAYIKMESVFQRNE